MLTEDYVLILYTQRTYLAVSVIELLYISKICNIKPISVADLAMVLSLNRFRRKSSVKMR